MNLATDLLTDLESRFAGRAALRIRALHLPPMPWTGNKDGEFGAIELDDGTIGLSYLLLDDALAVLSARRDDALVGADALAVARLWRDGVDGAQRALGFATLNALSRHLLDRASFVPPPASDSIAGLDPQRGEHIGMVGHFPPLLKAVTASGARLTVLELRADLVGDHDGYRVTLDLTALQTCDKVLATSTVLLNGTLDAVLANCSRASEIALIGPGAGCLPGALFARGVTVVGGLWVVDAPALVAALTRGESWGKMAKKFVLKRGDWSH
jgi:uncharacterized protein (DUF4213/DUF364 family)